jgi:hypothetical protein
MSAVAAAEFDRVRRPAAGRDVARLRAPALVDFDFIVDLVADFAPDPPRDFEPRDADDDVDRLPVEREELDLDRDFPPDLLFDLAMTAPFLD